MAEFWHPGRHQNWPLIAKTAENATKQPNHQPFPDRISAFLQRD